MEFILSKDVDLQLATHVFFKNSTNFSEKLFQGTPFSSCFRIELFMALGIRCCRGLR